MKKSQMWTSKEEGARYVAIPNNIHDGSLPAGMYWSGSSVLDNYQRAFYPIRHNSDSLVDLPGLPTRFILDQIDLFWDKTGAYKKFGFLQKRGILLYGPPGCGKSSVVSLLRDQIVKRNGVVFFSNDGTFNSLIGTIGAFRELEPERPIMTITEDIETLLEGNAAAANEKAALSLYDGENQFNNIDLKKFQTDKVLVGDEIAKILQGGGTGSGTSDAKLKQAADLVKESDSPAAIRA